ncbi:MAG: glycosyltransferase family 4 protein [Muribaculaceae bacterium]|nr:glycosyltransferase family 4 protein [Muribaculaceae bacterium]
MSRKSDHHIAVIGLRGFPGIQGGVESHCREIWPRIAGSGEFEVEIYRRRPYVSDTASQYPGIQFRDLPSTRIKGFEALYHTLLASLDIIARRKAAIVNIHNIGPGLLTPLLRLFGHKVVLTYHSPNYEHRKWGLIGRLILKAGEYISLRMASRIIFVNRFQMEKFPEKIRKKSIYIPNGINPTWRSTGTEFLEKHNLTPGQYILAVGRITPEKGFDDLIQSVQSLAGDTKLVIAGSPDHDEQYLTRLKALDTTGITIFTGFTQGEDLRQLYSHARLFVMSSVNEGFPIALLEAMTYRLPIVATDLPATRLFPSAYEYPMPAAPGNPNDLSEKIIAALERPYRSVDYDLRSYDWDAIAATTADVYRLLI